MRSGISTVAASWIVMLGASAWAQVTERESVGSGGVQGSGHSAYASVSADSRYVAFVSGAPDLVPGDTNGWSDVFVRDRVTGATVRVSLGPGGVEGNGDCRDARISADGGFVVFASYATNVVPGDGNGVFDVFVHDRASGTIERVSVSTAGAEANGHSLWPSISPDGRYVAFTGYGGILVPGDTNGAGDVFVRDRQAGTTELASLDSGGAQGNSTSFKPSISADGRYVAFTSVASNLYPGDVGGYSDVFVRDFWTGSTELVSVPASGAYAYGDSDRTSLSADGRYVAFESAADNLVFGDTNGRTDVFVRDRLTGTTERASVSSTGAQGDWDSSQPAISDDGRLVAFVSSVSYFVPGDTNSLADVFVRDRALGATERVSVSTAGAQAIGGHCILPAISADARCVVFQTDMIDLVPGDTNQAMDVFLRDRAAAGFASLCDPGVGGAIPCPCSNPPSGPGRGCDNSAGTGGAVLSASGVAYLSMDSLVFTTSGEKPTAASIVLQGTTGIAFGAVFGQGVRCAGGALKRLYAKLASGGSITAPDLGAGDPTVSVRSAVLGDVIQPGQSRWYLVYYRDPFVLGGCPASSSFNATQSGRVSWWP